MTLKGVMMKRLIACAVAALSMQASHADVIYEWNSAQDATPKDVAMRLVFADEVVRQGSYSYQFSTAYRGDYPLLTGLKEISFHATGGTDMAFAPEQYFPAPWTTIQLDLELRFLADGQLAGNIYFNDASSDVAMRSDGGLFSITGMHSDFTPDGRGISCDGIEQCSWSTGTLQRVDIGTDAGSSADTEVPEPGSLALVGLGLLGMARLARGRRRA